MKLERKLLLLLIKGREWSAAYQISLVFNSQPVHSDVCYRMKNSGIENLSCSYLVFNLLLILITSI